MNRMINLVVRRIDRSLEGAGMGLFFHPEWRRVHLYAEHDADGSFVLEVWRFQLIIDKGLRWFARR